MVNATPNWNHMAHSWQGTWILNNGLSKTSIHVAQFILTHYYYGDEHPIRGILIVICTNSFPSTPSCWTNGTSSNACPHLKTCALYLTPQCEILECKGVCSLILTQPSSREAKPQCWAHSHWSKQCTNGKNSAQWLQYGGRSRFLMVPLPRWWQAPTPWVIDVVVHHIMYIGHIKPFNILL